MKQKLSSLLRSRSIETLKLVEDSEAIFSTLYAQNAGIEQSAASVEDRLSTVIQLYPIRLLQGTLAASAFFFLLLPLLFSSGSNYSKPLSKLRKNAFLVFCFVQVIEVFLAINISSNTVDILQAVQTHVTALINLPASQHLHFVLLMGLIGGSVAELSGPVLALSLLPHLFLDLQLLTALTFPNFFFASFSNLKAAVGKKSRRLDISGQSGAMWSRHRSVMTLLSSVVNHTVSIVEVFLVSKGLLKLYEGREEPSRLTQSLGFALKLLTSVQFLYSVTNKIREETISHSSSEKEHLKKKTKLRRTEGKKKKSVAKPLQATTMTPDVTASPRDCTDSDDNDNNSSSNNNPTIKR